MNLRPLSMKLSVLPASCRQGNRRICRRDTGSTLLSVEPWNPPNVMGAAARRSLALPHRSGRSSGLLGFFFSMALLLTSLSFGLAAEHAAVPAPAGDPGLAGVASQIQHEYTLGKQFLYSYLTAFMFFLSICLGSLFLIILHHLFDAAWSVPIRRFLEHIACLAPVMLVLFIPVLAFAPQIYGWMNIDPHADHALHVKTVLFNRPTFTGLSIGLFLIWTLFSFRLRAHSLAQDKTGAAEHTYAMRKWAAGGIFVFAITLTLAAIYWMKSIQHAWFSTMYGVYYFAGSTWTALATSYVLALYLKKTGPLRDVIQRQQIYDMGLLFFAFTVFYAYIHFSQYFLIWNAAIPEETFWYVLRERGSWWDIGMLLIFGHFFLPFLCLLRIDVKLSYTIMVPMMIWAWLMHYLDMQFNVMPALNPNGFALHFFDVICVGGIGFILFLLFRRSFAAHPPYPIRDPRLKEALAFYQGKPVSPLALNTESLHRK